MAEEFGVSLRARFERFPATVKGAFVVRGEDPDPHQIAFYEARVIRLPGSAARGIPLDAVTLDVPPHKDLFVPFEFSIADLEPGWYDVEAEVDVDGYRRTLAGGKRFCVPWPRSQVRAASVRLDKHVKVGDATVSVERCHSGSEGLTVRYSVRPPGPVAIKLFADDAKLDVVEQEVELSSGKGVAKAYPLLRAHRELRIEVWEKGRSQSEPARIRVDLS
jgi:hypothetical protein